MRTGVEPRYGMAYKQPNLSVKPLTQNDTTIYNTVDGTYNYYQLLPYAVVGGLLFYFYYRS